MSNTITEFLEKYDLVDTQLSSYDNDTIQMIVEILNGNLLSDNVVQKNSIALTYCASYYRHAKEDYILAEKYNLMAIEQNNPYAMHNLGLLYEKQNKLDLAEKYYLMVIEQNNPKQRPLKTCQRPLKTCAMYNLGLLYRNQLKLDLAEKYFLMAIGQNDPKAMNGLGILYKKQNKLDLAKKYYLMAIEHDNKSNAIYNLGLLHERQNEFDLAIEYYLKAFLFDPDTMENIIRIIPKISQKLQLKTLELVSLMRTDDEYFWVIPRTVHQLFMDKKIKISRYLSRILIDDIVDICLAYY